MANPGQHSRLIFAWNLRKTTFALAVVCGLTMAALQSAQAQVFTTLHTFTGGGDGATPYAGLSMDRTGRLYGTASSGGAPRRFLRWRLWHRLQDGAQGFKLASGSAL